MQKKLNILNLLLAIGLIAVICINFSSIYNLFFVKINPKDGADNATAMISATNSTLSDAITDANADIPAYSTTASKPAAITATTVSSSLAVYTPTVQDTTSNASTSTSAAKEPSTTTATTAPTATTTATTATTSKTAITTTATTVGNPTSATTAGNAASAISSTSLSGKVICIDPGHQKKQNSEQEPVAPNSSTKKAKVTGGTSGTSTKTPEYVVTLSVGLKLQSLLENAGAKVVMTRDSNDVNISNIERAKLGNKAKADIAIRIHADGSTDPSVKGISMLVPTTDYLSDDLVKKSQTAGKIVLEKVIQKTGAKSRGVIKRNDMTGFNWSEIPVILIEMGFMSNPEEDKLLNTEDYQNKIAAGLFEGLAAYFE